MAEKDKKPTSGFDAITNKMPSGPIAIPRLVRGSDGLVHTIYIDAETGDILQSLDGYTVLSGENFLDPNSLQGGKGSAPSPEDYKEAANSVRGALEMLHDSGSMDGQASRDFGQVDNSFRDPSNNFGYIDKPGWLDYAGKVPGFGAVGKFANFAVNANNQSAVNAARTSMGLKPANVMGQVKGLAKDAKGQVANVTVGDTGKSYSVGLEAMSPDGKTNLTPNEARQRGLTLGGLKDNKTKESVAGTSSIQTGNLTANSGIGSDVRASIREALDTVSNSGLSKGNVSRGLGLASLTGAAGKAAVDMSGLAGKGRGVAPDQGLMDRVAKAAQDVLGAGASVNVSSGTYSPEQRSAIEAAGKAARAGALARGATPAQANAAEKTAREAAGQIGSNRHTTAKAVDTGFTNPDGTPATMDQVRDVAAQFALDNPNAGIGVGVGYMDADDVARAHLDITGFGGAWGGKKGMGQAMRETISAARAGFNPTPFSNAPTPTSRPSPSASKSFVSQDERTIDRSMIDASAVTSGLSPTAHNSITSQTGMPGQSYAKGVVSSAVNSGVNNRFSNVDLSTMSPAQAASVGMISRTAAQQKSIAQTIAGELSAAQLSALSKNDPVARMELANMLTTVENRAASKMFTSLDKALTPSQYNSLMEKNKAVTLDNYSKFAPAIDAAVADFYAGKLAPTNFGLTNYYNPEISQPGWGIKMTDPNQVGNHLFGALPEYGANKAFKDAREAYANSYSNYSGGGYSPSASRMDTPSEKSGIGRGSSGFGGNTNQSSGSSFGRGIGSDRGAENRSGASFGGGGIGSDRGSDRSSGGFGSGSSAGGFGNGGIGSDHSASPGGSSSSSGGSKGGGGIGSDHSADKSGKGGGFGSGGIGHA